MNSMYTLAVTHESVYVAVYTEESLLHFVTHCLGQTKEQWRMKQYTHTHTHTHTQRERERERERETGKADILHCTQLCVHCSCDRVCIYNGEIIMCVFHKPLTAFPFMTVNNTATTAPTVSPRTHGSLTHMASREPQEICLCVQ